MSDRFITDIPVWEDFPHEPNWGIEVRRGTFSGDPYETVIFHNPRLDKHIDISIETFDKLSWKTLKGIIENAFYSEERLMLGKLLTRH
jgi:hypothetical protein